jgi:hypothetical protein
MLYVNVTRVNLNADKRIGVIQMRIYLTSLLVALASVSCGGGSSSTTTSSTTVTPSQQLEATVASLCTTNCNATVPADNPSSRLEATINTLRVSSNPYNETNLGGPAIAADNPSAQLEATIARLQSSQQTSLGATHGGNMGSSQ